MRVGYLQFDPVFGDIERNLETVTRLLAQADADLIVLPELFAAGYQFVSKSEVLQLAETGARWPDHRAALRDAAPRMAIVAGLPERSGARCYNSAVIVGPSGLLGCHRKTNTIFFEETLFFDPGDSGFQVWDVGGAKVGVMICFDWFYPESARTLALMGADIIAHPSNLVLPHCPDSMVTRCLENRVFSITANRIGSEARGGKDRLTFIGTSEVVSPRGKILRRAPREAEELAILAPSWLKPG
ncbi:MAG: nitrilase-related carbon-nitrogen hydrolase [Nitrospiraceae bacterium]